MDPLGAKIFHSQISPQSKCAIVNAIWSTNFSPGDFSCISPADSYFQNYLKHCQPALRGGGNTTLLETHGDIVDFIRLLQGGQIDRISLRMRIMERNTGHLEDKSIDNSIDLAVRLWLMIPIGGFSHAVVPGQTVLPWTVGNLTDILTNYFDGNALLDAPVKLGKIFNASNIERIAGVRIIWTDNLADHLRMRDDDTGVCIFHYASFLRYHQAWESSGSRIFPEGFLEETLQTLALLLPQHDTSTAKWYPKYLSKLSLDGSAIKCGQLNSEDRQIEKFKFWRDRLVILKQIFDDAEPNTVKQWWRDRRKRVQWYTFWVAAMVLVLTIVFGLVQCIEGGLQAWKAFHP